MKILSAYTNALWRRQMRRRCRWQYQSSEIFCRASFGKELRREKIEKPTGYAERVQEQPRILGLDVGDRRIGVALSDPSGSTALPLITMGRSSLKQELKNIARLVRKHAIQQIVAGNPLHMSGEMSPQAVKAQAFAAALRDEFQLPVHLQDERLTSAAAHELLDRLGHPRGPARKAVLDQYAAVIILQDWLDGRERRGGIDAPGNSGPL